MASGKTLIALCLLVCSSGAWAQVAVAPKWTDLTPSQQAVLAPAAQDWDRLSPLQRTRLLRAAQHYPKLSPAEQVRFERNIPIWTHLPKETRDRARHNYQVFHALPPDKKAAIKSRWRAHQAKMSSTPNSSPVPGVPPALPTNASPNGLSGVTPGAAIPSAKSP
ncbi:MAG: DUF3106 domain-containing protein [Ferrovum sp.]|nr:DUF3106 domain-containing protein [Ferrovum sp.]NDU87231.1 DUF3106 domain-containing protein [Ferrovum sp.]